VLGHKIFAVGVFLDVEGAFDNTSFAAIGKAFVDHKVHSTISSWIAAMLSKHMVRSEIRAVSSTMMVLRGCLQGVVLSPLLWNMIINGKFLNMVCELMQKALLIVQIWCRRVGLSVNADKTSMVLFTNNKMLVGFKKPILFGTNCSWKIKINI
jgi:hypothetical protein